MRTPTLRSVYPVTPLISTSSPRSNNVKLSAELSTLSSEKGRISGIQSLGAVDGPGLRTVVFGVGCPLRCAYCHNPETWTEKGEEVTAGELAQKILRYKPYIAQGGVTFSGGEPLLQAKFFTALARLLKDEGLHVAVDTSGNVAGEDVDELIENIDLALLDVKFTNEEDYRKYTGGSLAQALDFARKIKKAGKRLWIRQVIVEGINDGEENIRLLKEIISPFADVIDKVELLPFRKLCSEKYDRLGLNFPFAVHPETSTETINHLVEILKSE